MKTILIVSPEPWGQNFISKHHYANEFSKLGHKVYFLNPPSNTNFTINDAHTPFNEVSIIDYKLVRGINKFPKFLRNFFNTQLIKGVLKESGNLDLVISFDPFRFQNLSLFKAKKTIYFPADWHNSPLEKEISNSADLIVSVSKLLASQYKKWNDNCLSIGHGVSDLFLESNPLGSVTLPKNDKLKIGYVGNLNYPLLDFKELKKIIEGNNNLDFHFIGPNGNSNLSKEPNPFWEKMETRTNVHLLGSQPFKDIPAYLSQFDALLLCYKGFEYKIFLSNNHKMLEYLSSGKPVISHYVDEYREEDDLLYMHNDEKQDFSHFFNEIIHNLDKLESRFKVDLRRSYAKQNLYKEKAIRLIELVS